MIPLPCIHAWSTTVPWPEPRQVEQDLLMSRAIVNLFQDPLLREALRFRGGTALHKLHFPAPLRYSEDIDLVRNSRGPIGPILGHIRSALEPWFGRSRVDRSSMSTKLRFQTQAETEDRMSIRPPARILTASCSHCQAQTSMAH